MAQTNTTTTVITTTSVNEGYRLDVSTNTTFSEVGTYVTDVSLQPYIANQIISFKATNMRPNQRLHIFFDGILVDQWCAPGYQNPDLNDTADYNSIIRSGEWNTAIYSDTDGVVYGQFNVPDGTFKTGDRTLQIADVDNLDAGKDALSTMASAEFTASNLSVTKQTITLTTVNPVLNYVPVTNTIVTVNTFTNVTVTPDIYNIYEWHWEPIAQALTINTPNGEAGIFATSIDLYFKRVSPLTWNGVGVYICETDNGYPNGATMLPFSWVHKTNPEITASADATVATRFVFESPVFLSNQKTYAFIVVPDQNDPDFWVWTANLGDLDVTTGVQVSSYPVVGTAFYGSTVHEWTALQTEYIKFGLNIANFQTGIGKAKFSNREDEYIPMMNIGYSNNSVSILPGDIAYQASNSTYTTATTSVYGIVDHFDPARQIIYLANSSGNWSSNSYIQIHRFQNNNPTGQTLTSGTLIAYANTSIIYNPRVNSVMPEFATMAPAGTSLLYDFAGTSNTGVTDESISRKTDVTLGYETNLYDYERVALSRSNEIALLGSSTKSHNLNVHMTSDTPLLSPVIDTARADTLALRNLIDPINSVYEEFYNTGRSRTKYISQVITLADGQDAEDLQIILSAYRPTTADIQVWVKFWNGQDNESLTDKTWTPMRNLSNQLFCDPSNPGDFKEFVYSTPFSWPFIATQGTITCTNTSTSVVGANTKFGTEIRENFYLAMKGNSTFTDVTRKIVSITDNTHITLDQPFYGNYTANSFYVVPPKTTAWMSQNTQIQLTGSVTTSTTNNIVTGYSISFNSNTDVSNANDTILVSDANSHFSANDRVYYYVPTGNNAIGGLTGNTWYYVHSTNTSTIKLKTDPTAATPIDLTASTLSQTHGLNKTNFTNELKVGSTIRVANDSQRVVSIANAIYLTVETPWATAYTEANAYNVSTAGLTYLSNDGSRYTSFKKFQIKIVMQSNDSSKVPIIDNLRALALQM